MSFISNLQANATTLVDAFIAASKPIAYDLYEGVNVENLNVFEKAWMNWYLMIGNPIIATGIMSFLMHEVSNLSICSLIVQL